MLVELIKQIDEIIFNTCYKIGKIPIALYISEADFEYVNRIFTNTNKKLFYLTVNGEYGSFVSENKINSTDFIKHPKLFIPVYKNEKLSVISI